MFRPEGKWGEMMRCLLNQNRPESSMLTMMMDKELVNLHKLKHKLQQPSVPRANEPTTDDAGDVWGQEAQLANPVIAVAEKPFVRTRCLEPMEAAALHLYYMRERPEYSDLWDRYVREAVGGMTPAERTARNIRSNMRGGWKFLDPDVLQTLRLQWRYWQPATGHPLTSEPLVQCLGPLSTAPCLPKCAYAINSGSLHPSSLQAERSAFARTGN